MIDVVTDPGHPRDENDPGDPIARLREATARWTERERSRGRYPAGSPALDALLGGGWPQGKVGELVGRASAGRTSAAAAAVAAATARGELVAWIDAADAFDPASLANAGVDLDRVLWVRPHTVEEAVRAAELVLELCGFTVVVIDLAGAPAGVRGGERRAGLRLRLARSVERTGAVALVLAERPWAGTLAGATVVLGPLSAHWRGGERSRWLDGVELRPRAERGGVRRRDEAAGELVAWRRAAGGG